MMCSRLTVHALPPPQTPAAMRDSNVKDVFVLFELLPEAGDGSDQRTPALSKHNAMGGLLNYEHTSTVLVDAAHPAARAALKAALRGDPEAAKVRCQNRDPCRSNGVERR
jgi:hypothetical protein